MIERQLTLIMENKPGALARVVGLFHQRGYNIDSLHVDPISDFKPYEFIEKELNIKFQENEVSKLTIKTTVGDSLMRQILRQINNLIEEISDSSFVIKPKPKPSKKVIIAALQESLSNEIESLTSYSSSQSTYIQVGAFRKENVSLRIADDISNKLGTTVEVIPTLISEPVMYRILVGPKHKDDIIKTIADLMELGISDYFLTHG